jgi:hypothetical protein
LKHAKSRLVGGQKHQVDAPLSDQNAQPIAFPTGEIHRFDMERRVVERQVPHRAGGDSGESPFDPSGRVFPMYQDFTDHPAAP